MVGAWRPDVPTTTKAWPCRLQPSAMCAFRLPVISISMGTGIGIGILLHKAMDVGLVPWLGHGACSWARF
jgi:hypothetical protein